MLLAYRNGGIVVSETQAILCGSCSGVASLPPDEFGSVDGWPVDFFCVFPGLSQYILLFIQGATVGQNNYDTLPGERECHP